MERLVAVLASQGRVPQAAGTKLRLYICLKNPFSARDHERMGIALLEQLFDLAILDCTAWLMPNALATRHSKTLQHPALKVVRSYRDLRATLPTSPGGYALDYVGQFSPQAVLLFAELKKRKIKLVVVDSGAHPGHDPTSTRTSWSKQLLRGCQDGGMARLIRALLTKAMLRVMPDQSPDIALVAGESWKTKPRFSSAKTKVSAHSFDYELYNSRRSSPALVQGRYAVYLDEKITGHEDNAELGLPDPASDEVFYPALLAFFDKVEQTANLSVVVAAYPSAAPEELQPRFAGRPAFVGQTALLVRDAEFVFAHGSTSVSFAVMSQKPVLFLTTHEIRSSWYYRAIQRMAATLAAPLVDIETVKRDQIEAYLAAGADHAAYIRFMGENVRTLDDAKNGSLWQILADTLDADAAYTKPAGVFDASNGIDGALQ